MNLPDPFIEDQAIRRNFEDLDRRVNAGPTAARLTSLPDSAEPGQIIYYEPENGVTWQLIYNEGETYPWEFVGGADLWEEDTTSRTASVGSWATYTGAPTITVPEDGVYRIEISGTVDSNDPTKFCYLGFTYGGAGPSVAFSIYARHASDHIVKGTGRAERTLTSGDDIEVQNQVQSGTTGTTDDVVLTVRPVRLRA